MAASLVVSFRRQLVEAWTDSTLSREGWMIVLYPHEQAYLVVSGEPPWSVMNCYQVTVPIFHQLDLDPKDNQTLWNLLVIYCIAKEQMRLVDVLTGLYQMNREELAAAIEGFINLAIQDLIELELIEISDLDIINVLEDVTLIEQSEHRQPEAIANFFQRLVPILSDEDYQLVRQFVLELWAQL